MGASRFISIHNSYHIKSNCLWLNNISFDEHCNCIIKPNIVGCVISWYLPVIYFTILVGNSNLFRFTTPRKFQQVSNITIMLRCSWWISNYPFCWPSLSFHNVIFLSTFFLFTSAITFMKFACIWNFVYFKSSTSRWSETWSCTSMVVRKFWLTCNCIITICWTFTIISFSIWCMNITKSIWISSSVFFVITSSNSNLCRVLEVMSFVYMNMKNKVNYSRLMGNFLYIRPIINLFIFYWN